MQSGILAKRGFQVDLASIGSGAAIIAAVVGGSADFGGGSLFPIFTAYGHGIPIRMIAPIAIYDSNRSDAWLVVQKDSDIYTPKDLNGKVLAADSPSDMDVFATRVWMDQRGGDGKSLLAIGIGASERLAAINQGRIATTVLRPPFLTIAMRSGTIRVIGKPLDAIAPRFLLSSWVATVDYMEKNPEAVRTFVAALSESARYVDSHPDETVDMVAQFTKQDPSQIRGSVREVIADSVTLADIQGPLDFAYKYGVVNQHYDAKSVISPFMPMSKAGLG